MSDTGEIVISQDWVSGDYSNIITISSAAIASVLLVIFKSRCSNISICFGLLSCNRKPKEESEEEQEEEEPVIPPKKETNATRATDNLV